MEFETPCLSESPSIFEDPVLPRDGGLPIRDYGGFLIGLHIIVAAVVLGLQVYNLQMSVCKIQ